ncbi:murein biosynthesis integral membrane protein MurJ [Streptomyces sp. NPDC054796]
MNAPYDGDRGRTPGDGSQPPEDPYARDAYPRDPYEGRDDPSTVELTGVDGLLGGAPGEGDGSGDGRGGHDGQVPQPPQSPPSPQNDAFAHLFRDQGHEPQHAQGAPPHARQHTPNPQQPPQPQAPSQAQAPPPPRPPHQPQHPDQAGHPGQQAQPAYAQQQAPRAQGTQQSQQTQAIPHTQQTQPAQQPFAPQQSHQPPQGPYEPSRQPQQPHQPQHPPYAASPPPPRPEAAPPMGPPAGAAAPGAEPVGQPVGQPGGGPSGPAGPPGPDAAPAAPPSSDGGGGGGGGGGLLKSSAIMAAGTMVSRLTGFVRSAMIVAALGAAVLGDTYQLAITVPTMIYVLTVGGGLNSVFVPQLVRAMKDDEDGGEAYANRLLTLVAVLLGVLTVLAVLAAPLLVKLMSVKIADNPQANEVAVSFVRYCLPTIFFMGIHVVMGQILNARGRFGAMMWTPVLNNIVIMSTIGMFLWVYGTAATSQMTVDSIPPEAVRLLGVGTLLGLVVQALAMVPYLRAAGFKVRPRFDWRGHGLGKAAKLAKWTILFVLANQAGVLVVSQLSTWAGETASQDGHSGAGYIAYSQAQLIWNMPQAIITVSVMAALLPRLSRAADDGDTGAVRDDISHGLRNSAVAIVPIAFGFIALGIPMCTMIYGSSGLDAARSMGYTLMAFGIGLIPFSVQYVVLRAFYAYEDTRTPFFNTVIVAAVNAVASAACFLVLPARWAVVGMAASYGLAYVIGVGVAWRRLRRRLGGDLDGSRVLRTYIRLAGASVPATLVAGAVVYGITQGLGSGVLGSVTSVLAGGIALGVVFVLAAKRMRIEEMTAMVGMVRARLGR